MTEHADHRFSATLSTPDLALIGCLRALAEFSEQTGNDTRPWRRRWGKRLAGRWPEGHLPFLTAALYRDLFKNEVRRLLPANLVRFDAESDDAPIMP